MHAPGDDVANTTWEQTLMHRLPIRFRVPQGVFTDKQRLHCKSALACITTLTAPAQLCLHSHGGCGRPVLLQLGTSSVPRPQSAPCQQCHTYITSTPLQLLPPLPATPCCCAPLHLGCTHLPPSCRCPTVKGRRPDGPPASERGGARGACVPGSLRTCLAASKACANCVHTVCSSCGGCKGAGVARVEGVAKG